jgi:4-hydroxy-3-polyprenylbenzoate decarboxylase
MTKQIILGVTGASGIPLATTLLEQLLASGCKVHLVFTTAGLITFKEEMEFSLSATPALCKQILIEKLQLTNGDNLHIYTNNDWFSPIASGSSVPDAMVICPCSMATLGKVANGIGDDLLSRAADVILKERKNLVIVPRETPFSAIHLDNMLTLSRLGVSILPPVVAFYTHPKSVDDIILFIVSRILDQLQVNNKLVKRWGK